MKKVSLYGASALVLLALTGCAQQNKQDAQNQLDQQTVMGLNWFQQSGEYQALAYQSFSIATQAFDHSASLTGKPKAVIVDLDETMLNNSAYNAWQVKAGKPFESESWSRWVQAKQATAVPGAVDFARYVDSHGGTVFYISNRDQKDYAATVENLQQLGFPNVTEKTVHLRTDNSNKQVRFDAIKAEGYNVVLYLGDNLNDFGAATYRKDNVERRAFVNQNHKLFGTQFIVLPNPLYGDWESGLAADYNKQTPEQQLQTRDANLKVWDGK